MWVYVYLCRSILNQLFRFFSFLKCIFTSETASSAFLLTSTTISIVRRVNGSTPDCSNGLDPDPEEKPVNPDPKFEAKFVGPKLVAFLCCRMLSALFVLSTMPMMQFNIWNWKQKILSWISNTSNKYLLWIF